MPIEITMPRLSDTMEQGTLIKWRVKVGDAVKSGDVLADIETDKATMELQSYDDGTVAQLAVEEGQTVAVGKRILLLAGEGETPEQAIEAAAAKAGVGPDHHGQAQESGEEETGQESTAQDGRIRVSPLARKLAEEHGVDLTAVRGSGPDGRIIKRDILAAAGVSGAAGMGEAAAPGASAAGPTSQDKSVPKQPASGGPSVGTQAAGSSAASGSELLTVSNMRQTIARRLVESKTTIPHFTVMVAVDMDPLLSLREKLNEQLAKSAADGADAWKLSVNDFVVRAAALALVKHPHLNSSWTTQGIRLFRQVNVGVAVALPQEKGGGLVVPTIRDAANKGLRQISLETRTLAGKAKSQGLSIEEMSDGTFTVSNLGMFGVEHFEAIINPPQAAILAVGSAISRPVVRDGQIVAGHEMSATLSADHRVVDGAMAAQWLATFRQMIENPAVLLV